MRIILFLATIFISLCSTVLAGPFAVYLTWQRDPTTTMTIQWLSEKGTMTSHVDYKEEGATDWISCRGNSHSLPQNAPYKVHVVELQNLKPNANYCFRFDTKGKTRFFRTMPKTLATPISFVVGGDTSQEGVETFKDTNRIAAKTEPFFAVLSIGNSMHVDYH